MLIHNSRVRNRTISPLIFVAITPLYSSTPNFHVSPFSLFPRLNFHRSNLLLLLPLRAIFVSQLNYFGGVNIYFLKLQLCGMIFSFTQWILIILLYNLAEITEALSPDGQALVNFRTAIVSSDGVLLQWRPEDEDPCGWKGVKCDLKSKRVIALSLPNHKLSGPISPDIGKLESLQFLALHDNNLYGAIPPELGNCTQLQSVFLQGNYLSGFVPSELGNLSQLQNLDLSSNSLSGSIPASLGQLRQLSSFNVSTNFLVGPIPSDGVLANFQNDSFLGNRGLCGKQTQTCKNNDSGSSTFSQPSGSALLQAKKNSGRLLISALATVGALLLVALMCFWGCYLYKRLGKNDGKGLAVDVSGGVALVPMH